MGQMAWFRWVMFGLGAALAVVGIATLLRAGRTAEQQLVVQPAPARADTPALLLDRHNAPPAPSTPTPNTPDPVTPAKTGQRTPEELEIRRFDRYDRDKDEQVSRAEYLRARQRAFDKLDSSGDGMLDFEEYAIATSRRFAGADGDGDQQLTRAEFATTRQKR